MIADPWGTVIVHSTLQTDENTFQFVVENGVQGIYSTASTYRYPIICAGATALLASDLYRDFEGTREQKYGPLGGYTTRSLDYDIVTIWNALVRIYKNPAEVEASQLHIIAECFPSLISNYARKYWDRLERLLTPEIVQEIFNLPSWGPRKDEHKWLALYRNLHDRRATLSHSRIWSMQGYEIARLKNYVLITGHGNDLRDSKIFCALLSGDYEFRALTEASRDELRRTFPEANISDKLGSFEDGNA